MKRVVTVLCCAIAGACLLGSTSVQAGGIPAEKIKIEEVKMSIPTRRVTSAYERPFATPTRPAFMSLPPGAVEPDGWLRDWCLAARDGYTGCMDEVDPAFRQAWATDYKMTGENLFWEKGGWPYEGGALWFDGLARLGYVLHDDSLIKQIKTRLDAVVTNMHEKSIQFLWWLDRTNPNDVAAAEGRHHREVEWPLWMGGEMGRAVAAYYEGSRDPRVLRVLETAYTGNREWLRMGWAPTGVWPAFETYSWSGNKEIKESLTEFFAKGCDKNKRWTWNQYTRMPANRLQDEKDDHGMHMTETLVAWSLGYLWTGNREFLNTSLAWNDLIEREATLPFGVLVSDEHFHPTGAARLAETCSVACDMWLQTRLLLIAGQGRLADRVERAFFNAAPSVVSRDFKTHVYLQSPNRVSSSAGGQTVYRRKHYPLCCTASLNRLLPNYVMHMWMATYDNGLVATCYGPCKVSALVADRLPVEITCQTDYPFNESIKMTVNPANEAIFPLVFRIPCWCANATITVNGVAVKAAPSPNGFVRVERPWKPGDTVELQFPMSVRVAAGHDRNMKPPAPYGTVSYGPLLFALPITDTTDANTPDPSTKWNYALDMNGGNWASDIKVERGPMPARWDWPVASPLKLRVQAASCEWNPTPKTPLPTEPVVSSNQQESIVLIPYGCTKLRVSMFPVTEQALKGIQNGNDAK